MPKITTHRIKVDGQIVILDILYNSKKEFHAKGIPDPVRQIACEKNIFFTGEREQDLIKKIDEAVKAYHEAKKKMRKVIVYSIELGRDLVMEKNTDEYRFQSYQGYQSWVPEALTNHHHDQLDGKGFTIDWGILYQVSDDNKTVYYRINGDDTLGNSTYIKQNFVIDWTEEREKTFKAIDEALKKLVQKIAPVLGDIEVFTNLLDSGIKLLPEV
ncbi:MAG: hypothetical protein CVU62_13380 [Deltaproteobacteria bacterium HGW-Deltaproteobacteria-2]|jgi:hypothetical protein|nr:MAG: hypothetical protein CVU62_13380 [Deltaproteobacteria bacterium HGW-Deltaproteobacteria-2]